MLMYLYFYFVEPKSQRQTIILFQIKFSGIQNQVFHCHIENCLCRYNLKQRYLRLLEWKLLKRKPEWIALERKWEQRIFTESFQSHKDQSINNFPPIFLSMATVILQYLPLEHHRETERFVHQPPRTRTPNLGGPKEKGWKIFALVPPC